MEEVGAGADPGDLPVAHDKDAIAGSQHARSVGDDDDGGSPPAGGGDGLVQGRLALGVEGGVGLVHDDDAGLAIQGAGQGDALGLAGRQAQSAGAQNGVIGAYVHSDGLKAALVVAEGANTEEAKEVARGIAMQAVALRAPYLNAASVPEHVIESEKALYRTQAAEEGKPEAMQDKIAEGRLGKYFKENTLVEQAFIRDDKKSVQQVAKEVGVTIDAFVRFEVGQA